MTINPSTTNPINPHNAHVFDNIDVADVSDCIRTDRLSYERCCLYLSRNIIQPTPTPAAIISNAIIANMVRIVG